MKTLWCGGLVLLLAVEAGAGEPQMHDIKMQDGAIYHLYGVPGSGFCRSGDGPHECWFYPFIEYADHRHDPCLAQMEAAMRAMEPYLPFAEQDPDTTIYSDKWMYWAKAATQQWDASKACWRTP